MTQSSSSTIMNIPLSDLEHAGLAAANRASDLLQAGFYADIDVKTKSGKHDLVTQYDQKSEALITATLKEFFPDHAFVGEEMGIQGDTKNTIYWVIDPIDGTWNFSRQIPSFAISIAACYQNKAYVGICLDPISKELFIAKRGGGATMNGKALKVSATKELEDSGISFGTSVGVHAIHKIALIRRSGSTVLDLCYVAKGALEGFINHNQRAWDYAAAQLIVEESGGLVTTFEGRPLPLTLEAPNTIVASNTIIHEELIKWISLANE